MTDAPDLTPSAGPGARKAGAAGPVKEVRLLLPVWGEQFIVQFLRISLPTLLAPGNLPAVAAAVPCTFVFLTNTEGAELLREHPAVAYLQGICEVEFDIIDDLITGDNYSTTLTLGYARAVRSRGPAMLDTCFFFLISDYIMADGSLFNVLARVQSGNSGVLAGNFQVVEEDAKDPLFERFETDEPSIVISSRDLMGWALNYLHPMTLANTVNFPIYSSIHSNRLFWRVDENTLIGRFYLMHMIAIRPDIPNFHVGSSCDYSFIPEMCPSGKVHVMTDSDEYLVVEMQKRTHEEKFIHLGATNHTDLTKSLAEWTTERHRLNAYSAVVYRAGDASVELPVVIEESRKFVEAIEANLPAPQPYRNHPYWIGAIAAHRREVWRRHQQKNPLYAPESAPPRPPATYHDFLFRIRDFLVGRPTHVWPWHPRWPDYQMIQKLAERFLAKKTAGRALVLSSTPAVFQGWLQNPTLTAESLSFLRLLAYDAEQYERLVGRFNGCLLVVREADLSYINDLLERIKPLLGVGDYLLIFILNGHGLRVGWQFNQDILQAANKFLDRRMMIEQVEFVAAGSVAWIALRSLRALYNQSMRNPLFLILTSVPIVLLLLFSMVGNIIGRRAGSRPFKNELCSSVGVVMRIVALSMERPKAKDSSELKQSRRRFMKKRAPLAPADGIESV